MGTVSTCNASHGATHIEVFLMIAGGSLMSDDDAVPSGGY